MFEANTAKWIQTIPIKKVGYERIRKKTEINNYTKVMNVHLWKVGNNVTNS